MHVVPKLSACLKKLKCQRHVKMKGTSTHTPITVSTLKCYRTLIAQNRIEILCTKIKIFSRIKSSLMSEQVNKLGIFCRFFFITCTLILSDVSNISKNVPKDVPKKKIRLLKKILLQYEIF